MKCTVPSTHTHTCPTTQSTYGTTTGRNNKLIRQTVLIDHHFVVVVVQEATNCAVNCFSHHSTGSTCNTDKIEPMATHTPFLLHSCSAHTNQFERKSLWKLTQMNRTWTKANEHINSPDCDISFNYAFSCFINFMPCSGAELKHFQIKHHHHAVEHSAWRDARIENQIKLC